MPDPTEPTREEMDALTRRATDERQHADEETD